MLLPTQPHASACEQPVALVIPEHVLGQQVAQGSAEVECQVALDMDAPQLHEQALVATLVLVTEADDVRDERFLVGTLVGGDVTHVLAAGIPDLELGALLPAEAGALGVAAIERPLLVLGLLDRLASTLLLCPTFLGSATRTLSLCHD